MEMNKDNKYDKVLGCLLGCALGDAMGAVTENLTFDQIREKYHGKVTEMLVPDKSAFAYGNCAGQVTDDFSQTYLLTRQILAHGKIEKEAVEDMLIDWSHMPVYFNRFAGPTTRAAIAALQEKIGEKQPETEKKVIDYASQATNGSAMKIAPAGLFAYDQVDEAIQNAFLISSVTHNNQLAISGACAVAAFISASFKTNATLYSAIEAAFYGAEKGEQLGMQYGHIVGGASVKERMNIALTIGLSGLSREEKMRQIYEIVGSGLHISEAVPAAIGIIVACKGDPWDTIVEAVNIGYDTDTVAAIAGSMVGALNGTKNIPEGYLPIIEEANDMEIQKLAKEVCAFIENK